MKNLKVKKYKHLSFEDRCVIEEFLNHKYTLNNNQLTFYSKKLTLSNKDLLEFPNIIDYIKTNFENKVYN